MSNQVDRTWSTALPRLVALLVTLVGMLNVGGEARSVAFDTDPGS